MGIKKQILLLMTVVLLLSVVSSFFVSLNVFSGYQEDNIEIMMNKTNIILESKILSLERKAINESTLIAKIPELADYFVNVKKNDLKNLGNEYRELFSVDIIDFYDKSEEYIVSLPRDNGEFDDEFEIPEHLLERSKNGEVAADFVYRENKFAFIASAPIVKGNKNTGYIVTGSYIDDNVANILKEQTNADISFFTLDNVNSASSLDDKQKSILQEIISKNQDYLLRSGIITKEDFQIRPYDLLNKDDDDLGFAVIQLGLKESRKAEENLFSTMMKLGCVTLILGLIIAYLMAYKLSDPIVKLKNFTDRVLESNDLSLRCPLKNGPAEIKSLRSVFNLFLDNIEKSQKKIKEYSENLEVLVKERTKELETEKDKIKRILEHIELGIITIDEERKVGEQYSSFVEKIYNKERIAIVGVNGIDLVFEGHQVSPNDYNQMDESLNSMLGDSDIGWDLNSHLLINEAELKIGSETKIIALDWTPIIDEEDIVKEIMITVKDITAQRLLEIQINKEKEKNERIMIMISEIINNDRESTVTFLEDSKNRLSLINENLTSGKPDPEKLFVNLHTIKGNSRSLQLKKIMDASHVAENYAQELRKGNSVDLEDFKVKLREIEDIIDSYIHVIDNILKGKGEVSQTNQSILNVVTRHLKVVSENLNQNAIPLNKIMVNDSVLNWDQNNFKEVSNVLVHAMNNSIDHGYLLPSKAKQKTNAVSMEIIAKVDNDNVLIEIIDEGNGIDLAKIKKIIEKNKLYDGSIEDLAEEELINFIFKDGFTTSDNVTESSGRGSGMSAIKDIVSKFDGTIKMSNQKPGTKLSLWLPKTKVYKA